MWKLRMVVTNAKQEEYFGRMKSRRQLETVLKFQSFPRNKKKEASQKFIPEKTDTQETICVFEACDGTGIQYDVTPNTSPSDPLSAWTVMSTPAGTLPQWCKFFYVYCISNKKGRLEVTVS